MKKVFAALMALVLLFSFTAFATETATPLYLPEMPLVDEPTTLTALIQRNSGGQEWDTFWFWKWVNAHTGITFDVTEYDSAVFEEKANLLFASGEIPDIIFFVGGYMNNARVVQYGVDEGLLMPLEDLIAEYAPNITTVFEAHPELRTLCTASDGHIYTLPQFGGEIYNTARSFINQDWLAAVGKEVPTTIEEFHDVMIAFRDGDPNGNGEADEIPFGGNWDDKSGGVIFFTSFGMPVTGEAQLYLDGDTVKLPGYEDNYFDMLVLANQFYNEGLFDVDIFTQDTVQSRSKSADNRVGYVVDDSTALLSGNEETMWSWIGLGGLTSELNDTPMWPSAKAETAGAYAISADCADPIAAIKFADMFFTQEASIFFQWGAQLDDEENEMGFDGWFINEETGSFDFIYPEGYDSSWVYRCAMVVPTSTKVGSSEYFKALPNVYGYPFVLDAGGAHFRDEMDRYMDCVVPRMPDVYLSAEEIEERAEIAAVIEPYMASMEKKFITGAEPLTEENFEAYREELRNMGVERYIEMHQTAYNGMIGA